MDSFNLIVNIFLNYFCNWCTYDCRVSESLLSEFPLSEVKKVKSWCYMVTQGMVEKARYKIRGRFKQNLSSMQGAGSAASLIEYFAIRALA